jgi:hypothetical protein
VFAMGEDYYAKLLRYVKSRRDMEAKKEEENSIKALVTHHDSKLLLILDKLDKIIEL